MTYVVELEPGVWLADVQGDPGRTLVLANARRWGSRSAAWRALNKAKQPNKHFRFRNAKVVKEKGEAGV